MYPALQLEGIGGAILASFADLASDRHYVVRIKFPERPRQARARQRHLEAPAHPGRGRRLRVDRFRTACPPRWTSVTTLIGASYRPTIVWRTDDAVGFTRFDGKSGLPPERSRWTSP